MVRRRKKSRRRSPKTVSLWNIGESYIVLSMFTGAVLGNTPMGIITGLGDIKSLASVSDSWNTGGR